MGRRYRRRKSGLGSMVHDVIVISSKLNWFGALLVGFIGYVLISVFLSGLIENQLEGLNGNIYKAAVEPRFKYLLRACDWVGKACLIAGAIIATWKLLFSDEPDKFVKSVVSWVSKLLGRNFD